MSEAMRKLGLVSREYEALATEYRAIALNAAEAESNYRKVRAQTMLRAMVNDNASAAKAEIVADADDVVSAECTEYKCRAAIADAARQKLNQLREQVAVGRSVMVAEREQE